MTEGTVKRFRIQDVKPGMLLGRTIFLENGTVVLEEGITLTTNMIERLKNWDIFVIDIAENIPALTTPLKKSPSEAYLNFVASYQDTLDTISFAFEDIRYFRKVPLAKLRELTHSTVTGLVAAPGALNFVHTLYRNQIYTFQHSLDVAVISGILGRLMGYTDQALQDIMLTGLLHDIGKMQLPREILDKEGPLSAEEMSIMRTHPTLGYKMLSQLSTLPLTVLSGVLQHHERLDGSGYPLKLADQKIHPYAQIVAVADMYDAMTANKPYRARMTPFEAVQVLVNDMFSQLNPTICSTFLHNLQAYLVGQIVRLSDGRDAEVVFFGGYMSNRPIVRTKDGEFIDLEEIKHLTIVDMLHMDAPLKQQLRGG